MNRPAILAIDTSTDSAGIGLLGGGIRIALTWDAGRNQTTSVLDQVDRCLSLGGITPRELGGIAVAIGPGKFTSLRVGVSLAKGLAFGLDLPIIGVPTLEVTVRPWVGFGRSVVGVVSVGRGRVVWQRFDSSGDSLTEAVNGSIESLEEEIGSQPDAVVVGELPDELVKRLAENEVMVRAEDRGRRDPLLLASVGADRIDRLGPDALVSLQPIYLHSRPVSVPGA